MRLADTGLLTATSTIGSTHTMGRRKSRRRDNVIKENFFTKVAVRMERIEEVGV